MNNKTELYDPSEYVELRKLWSNYLKKEEVDSFWQEALKIFRVATEKSIDKTAENIVQASGDQSAIEEALANQVEIIISNIARQLREIGNESWAYYFMAYTLANGIQGNKTEGNEDREFLWLAYQAKFNNNIEYREVLRDKVIDMIEKEKPLPNPAKEWLLYFLNEATIPHKTRGAHAKDRATLNRRYELAKFVCDYLKTKPDGKATHIINAAAKHFSLTFEKTRGDYYSEDRKKFQESLKGITG